jgi:hypothetical protein
MAVWLLGRDELLKAGTECDRKILVLTDGHLNQGITEPDRVEALTRSRFSKDGIRTGCLGFGNSYQGRNTRGDERGSSFTTIGAGNPCVPKLARP